ncbi:hypothetical protein VFPFJ_07679 [Purpureocillium lilacinum]|uniref:Uncharacterized protein n=1 Tax=Purpureocillium lilacinum TaxID=33203 RepID=A0A179H6R0_PURLI|nr:hypothetical protein VFPFJ_07679 [Purpureocillium lilacinum]OAQ85290.1 hypothetical protein VFPFJ_07679 [Purpureocillium lilacinum]
MRVDEKMAQTSNSTFYREFPARGVAKARSRARQGPQRPSLGKATAPSLQRNEKSLALRVTEVWQVSNRSNGGNGSNNR